MRFLPIALAGLAIFAAAVFDFTTNVDTTGVAQKWAEAIETQVPKEIGPWVGEDREVADEVLLATGAIGKIDRLYTNQETGESVHVWFIVGHMQSVARHTPPVCYGAQRYKIQEPKSRFSFPVEGEPIDNQFWTTWFYRALPTQAAERPRVFWAWTVPQPGEPLKWSAPDEARFAFPGTKALFKLYFTSTEPEDDEQPLEESSCAEFAKLFLPIVTDLLETRL